MADKVVTMGEIMLRLSTPDYSRFVQSQQFDVNFGGGEANVAVSLANYGFDSYFISKLPKHEIGQAAVNSLRKYGVRTDYRPGRRQSWNLFPRDWRKSTRLEGNLRLRLTQR